MAGVGGQQSVEKLAKACGFVQKWTLREVREAVSPLPHPVRSTGPQYGSCACVLSRYQRVGLFVIPWTVACQASPFMGFPRQE